MTDYIGKTEKERRYYDYRGPKTIEDRKSVDEVMRKIGMGVLDKRLGDYLEHTGDSWSDIKRNFGSWPHTYDWTRIKVILALLSDYKKPEVSHVYHPRDPENPALWNFYTSHHYPYCQCWHCNP